MADPSQITQMLSQLRGGDPCAAEQLLPLVYHQLRALAEHYLRDERPGHTLQPTALVHEAYVRLVGPPGADWKDRAHFFAVAARAMRQILVDYARARGAAKRGGAQARVPLDQLEQTAGQRDEYLVALDDALSDLTVLDAHLARLVELRFFGGLDIDETAAVLGVSASTVKRDWLLAKGWLHHEVTKGD